MIFAFTRYNRSIYFRHESLIWSSRSRALPGIKIREFIFHYRENILFTVLIPTTFWLGHGKRDTHKENNDNDQNSFSTRERHARVARGKPGRQTAAGGWDEGHAFLEFRGKV